MSGQAQIPEVRHRAQMVVGHQVQRQVLEVGHQCPLAGRGFRHQGWLLLGHPPQGQVDLVVIWLW